MTQLDCKNLITEGGKLPRVKNIDSCSAEYLRQIGHGDSVPDVFEGGQFTVLLVIIIHYTIMVY